MALRGRKKKMLTLIIVAIAGFIAFKNLDKIKTFLKEKLKIGS